MNLFCNVATSIRSHGCLPFFKFIASLQATFNNGIAWQTDAMLH